MTIEATTDREILELALYKIQEMLRFGEFEESHEANFKRAFARIKTHLESPSKVEG